MRLFLLALALLGLVSSAQAANQVLVDNDCSIPVRFLLRHNLGNSNWATSGWYTVPASAKGFVLTNPGGGGPVFHQASETLYLHGYAPATGKPRYFYGVGEKTIKRPFAGKTYDFSNEFGMNISSAGAQTTVQFFCPPNPYH